MNDEGSLEAVSEVQTQLLASTSREEAYAVLVDRIEDVIGLDACQLAVERDGELVPVASAGLEVEDPTHGLSFGSPVAEQVYQSQEPRVVSDAGQEVRDDDAEYRSVLSVPLGTHGVLILGASEPDAFDDQALALADLIGRYADVVLDRQSADLTGSPPTVRAPELPETHALVLVALDADGLVTDLNQRARELLGDDSGTVVGQDWFDTCLPGRVRTAVRDDIDALVADDDVTAASRQYPVHTAHGEERAVDWHVVVHRDDDGRHVGTLLWGVESASRKVHGGGTERTESERERQAAEFKARVTRYRTLVEQFPNGLVTLFDETHRYQLVGGRGLDELALSADELEGRRLQDVFPPENVERLEPLYDRAFEGESSSAEVPLEDRIFRVHVLPVRADDGSVIAGMTMSQDVTEQRALERELRERELHLSQAQAVADAGSWRLDIPTGDLHWTENCYRIFGLPPDEPVTYERFLEYVHPADREYVDEEWEAALTGQPYDLEHRIVVHGEVRWVREQAVLEFDEAGNPRQGIGVVQDITDRKEREQELDAARQRYQALLHAAPDPVFVADVQTGDIIEANRAAQELRGQSREEILGMHQSGLHPEDDAEAYRALFRKHIETGGSKRRLPDGSPIYVTTGEGNRVPVEISVKTVDLDDGAVIYGVFRDISEQLEYERALTGLNDAARELFEVETASAVGQCVVETVTDVLDLCGAAFYRYDDSEGLLRPVAYSPPDDLEGLLDELPTFEPDESIAWRVFLDGEPAVFDDVRDDDDVYNPDTPIRSEIIVPLGVYGVLIVGDTRPYAFDGHDIELVQVLGSTVEAALERTEREQDRKRRERLLQNQTRQLEQVEAINGQIRDVAQSIVHSENRTDVEQAVCSQLVETDQIEFVWLGDVDPVNESITPRALAGDDRGYLEGVSLSLDDESAMEPAVRTARTHEPVVVSNTAKDLAAERWREHAVSHRFQSVMGIPLRYRGALLGVLAIYASTTNAFTGLVQSVVGELGDLIAHGLVALNRKQTLLSNQAIELDFDIQNPTCFLLRFAAATESTLELEGTVPQADESSIVFVRVREGDPGRLLEHAEQSNAIVHSRLIESDGDSLVQFRIAEPFIVSILAEQGILVRNISADSSNCRVTMAVPPTFNVRQVVDVVESAYPDSVLVAKREQSRSLKSVDGFTERVAETLTARQREVVELAYQRGYFDSPRRAGSEELSAELGFSTSAFHQHIRAAERKLFETAFDAAGGTPDADHAKPN